MKKYIRAFWHWYDRHLKLNITVTAFLFSLQLGHLFWLATDVIAFKLLGYSLFHPTGFYRMLIIVADYTEIPALFSAGLLYVNQIRLKGYHFKSVLYIIFLVLQIFHMFWITDEFVVSSFVGGGEFVNIPPVLAWVAILIDYLELPVIFETFKKLYEAFNKKDIDLAMEALNE